MGYNAIKIQPAQSVVFIQGKPHYLKPESIRVWVDDTTLHDEGAWIDLEDLIEAWLEYHHE